MYYAGNLEPTVRLEVVGHDQTLAWDQAAGQNKLLLRYTTFNWFVQVRIIDIRIFWRYENAFNQIRRFSDEVSHELRTPLSLIRLHAEKMLIQEVRQLLQPREAAGA